MSDEELCTETSTGGPNGQTVTPATKANASSLCAPVVVVAGENFVGNSRWLGAELSTKLSTESVDKLEAPMVVDETTGEVLSLSVNHILPEYSFEWSEDGDYCALRYKSQLPAPPEERGDRGACKGFSSASRARLLKLCGSVPRTTNAKPLFITLTYGATWPEEWGVWKQQLIAFRHAWEREYGKVGGVWRLEFQQRGAPHFHLMMFRERYIDMVWLKDTWTRIVTGKVEGSFRLRTEVKKADSWSGVMAYCAKYMSKAQLLPAGAEGFGRMWGVWWKEELGINIIQVSVGRKTFHRLRRALAAICAQRQFKVEFKHANCGLWCFLADAECRRLIAYFTQQE